MRFRSVLLAAAPIVSIGLYENDMALVRRQVTPQNESACVEVGDVIPCEGTLWHTSADPLAIRTFEDSPTMTVSFFAPLSMSELIRRAQAEGGFALNIADRDGEKHQDWTLYSVEGELTPPSHHLRLKSGSFIEFDDSVVAGIRFADGIGRKGLPRNKTTWEFKGAKSPFEIEYVARGAFWTPAYRLALGREKSRLFMSGNLVNNLADWTDVEVSLISGNCRLAEEPRVLSRANGGMGMRYLSAKAKRTSVPQVAAADSFYESEEEPSDDGYRSLAGEGRGSDISSRPLGKVSLAKGEQLVVPLGVQELEVKRLVEWTESGLWDAVKFRNPFDFPMPAATIEVVEEGRLLGMPRTSWANAGDETFVKITAAQSVKGKFDEQSQNSSGKWTSSIGETMAFNGQTYRKERKTAFFTVVSFRKEPVAMSVKRTFAGAIAKCSLEPKETKTRPSARREFEVNSVQELMWEFDLQPGEKREWTVEYDVWL